MTTPRPTAETRRQFLGTTAALAAVGTAPVASRSGPIDPPAFRFLHTAAGRAWEVDDPVARCLRHAGGPIPVSGGSALRGNTSFFSHAAEPMLRRAVERLRPLTPADGRRVIRRCGLNLLEVRTDRVRVHHRGVTAGTHLRPFFKVHGLARAEVTVVLTDRKRETDAERTGADVLYAERCRFDLDPFLAKWEARFRPESDDRDAAPGTRGGFGWDGVKVDRIPWHALKSALRNAEPVACPNCDVPAVLLNFGVPRVRFLEWGGRFGHGCGRCRRWSDDLILAGPATRPADVQRWVADTLDRPALPGRVSSPPLRHWRPKPA